ncbi:MAG: GNAT family N-acetyltransferase [Deltaproteobacteria bacterium]|nr:GNAT family N-acetyltransferase [Deltaproteobacteria bacterium]
MLKGKKIQLVPLESDDLARSRFWVNDAFLSSRMLRVLPVTQYEQEKWYQDIVQNPSKIVFAIKTLDGKEHIGNAGLYHIDWIHRRAEFWILIGEQNYWAQGIGAEVVSLIKWYAFNNLNFNRLYLNVGADNRDAIALYKKLNFVQEGIFKEHYYIQGKYLDIITMAILKADYDCEK